MRQQRNAAEEGTVSMTHPMTLGQLSVWRDIEVMPPDRWWEGNLFFRWAVPAGTPGERVWPAIGALGMRHESLRTTFDVSDPDDPRQRISAGSAEAVVAAVRRPSGPDVDRARIETDEVRRAFQLTEELPWRVWLAGPADAPTEVYLVIHHMAADGAALNVLEREFAALLADVPLAEAPQPSALARRQRDGSDGQLLAAEAYWRKTLAAAPRNPAPPGPGPVLRATLLTGIPEPLLRAAAQRIGVTPPTVVLAAYGVVLDRTTTSAPLLLYPMSSNRFDPAVAGLVTSMNQWVPLLFDPAPDKPFAAIVRRLHFRSLGALKHGIYDPDVIARVRAEAGRDGGPVDPGYHFTYLLPPMTVRPPAGVTEPWLEWHVPIRGTGPGFYLMVNAHEEVNLTLRVIRAGYSREALEAVLGGVRELLLGFVTGSPA
jgi:hypothetical protein